MLGQEENVVYVTNSFLVKPQQTIDMEYLCDRRKDKCLKGQNAPQHCPTVRLKVDNTHDVAFKGGVIKVATVCSVPNKTGKYSLHPNLLTHCKKGKNEQSFCDEHGVATYPFKLNANFEATVELRAITIRRASPRKGDHEMIAANWLKQDSDVRFDPYGCGYSEQAWDFHRLRICYQVFFSNGSLCEPIVSDEIINGNADIKIEYFDEGIEVNVNGGTKLHMYVRKLTTDQKDICLKVYDSEGWEFVGIEPTVHKHHDYAFVFEAPAYKTNAIREPVECWAQLYVKDKPYESESKKFIYMPLWPCIALKRTAGDAYVDDDCEFNGSPTKKPRFQQQVIEEPPVASLSNENNAEQLPTTDPKSEEEASYIDSGISSPQSAILDIDFFELLMSEF